MAALHASQHYIKSCYNFALFSLVSLKVCKTLRTRFPKVDPLGRNLYSTPRLTLTNREMMLLLPALLCASVAPRFGGANDKWDKWTTAVQMKSFQLEINHAQSSNVQAKITSISSHPPGETDGSLRIGFKSVDRIAVASDSSPYGSARAWGGCDVRYDPHTKKFSLPLEQKNLYVRFRSGIPTGAKKPGTEGEITIVDVVGKQTASSPDDARKAGEAVVKVLNEQKWEEESAKTTTLSPNRIAP